MTVKQVELYPSLNNLVYTIFSVEDGDTLLKKGTISDVLDYMNSMVTDLNADLEDDERTPLCNNLQDVLNCSEYYGVKVCDTNNKDNKVVIYLIEQALKFNSSWVGETEREGYKGYYKFSIKPLYMDDTDYLIQVACSLMCPSGVYDNGIKHVTQYMLNKHAFKDVEKLCKHVLYSTLRGKGGSYQPSYIQF